MRPCHFRRASAIHADVPDMITAFRTPTRYLTTPPSSLQEEAGDRNSSMFRLKAMTVLGSRLPLRPGPRLFYRDPDSFSRVSRAANIFQMRIKYTSPSASHRRVCSLQQFRTHSMILYHVSKPKNSYWLRMETVCAFFDQETT
ncbi:hypothetical protein AUEXF2481DRAFT_339622 [Aureobasidium subglaciale EXF-2481]|uniref:Uncharacterized protein n=1 Tax=Aureobasidium subglaciale (strain EXF-2481) TaxID=1043005 RepID=A0A074Y6G4_AURSE|nr:uncharacterized protein AUEXF2481DRAFT_339622 [Aureobasidium subglaciale EXF-2481]KEQ93363.1 hypothetical protein AUEXF2481DRAFT_339622 [Aureobasidium subglaciale EXF-2481]